MITLLFYLADYFNCFILHKCYSRFRINFDEILSEYPDLELDDIKQSLQYAAFLTRETVYPFKNTA